MFTMLAPKMSITYMHARTHACTYPRMHTCMHACTHTHTHTHMHMHTHTHAHTHARTLLLIWSDLSYTGRISTACFVCIYLKKKIIVAPSHKTTNFSWKSNNRLLNQDILYSAVYDVLHKQQYECFQCTLAISRRLNILPHLYSPLTVCFSTVFIIVNTVIWYILPRLRFRDVN